MFFFQFLFVNMFVSNTYPRVNIKKDVVFPRAFLTKMIEKKMGGSLNIYDIYGPFMDEFPNCWLPDIISFYHGVK